MTEEEKRTEFAKLTPQEKLSIIKPQLDIYVSSVSDKSTALVSISGLSATLLVVATFNPALIPLNNLVRAMLSILLVMVPIGLLVYIRSKNAAAVRAIEIVQSYTGQDPAREIHPSCIDKLIARLPEILAVVLAIIVILIILLIWRLINV